MIDLSDGFGRSFALVVVLFVVLIIIIIGCSSMGIGSY
ncbi:YjcZ family sporulation protein [Jeotgalibacillus soli]